MNADRYIFIKKVAGSKHPEVVNIFLDAVATQLNVLSETQIVDERQRFSNIEKYYMINIKDDSVFRHLQENYTPETVYRNYQVKVYYFNRLFSQEFEELDIPIFTLQHMASERPIYLESYRRPGSDGGR